MTEASDSGSGAPFTVPKAPLADVGPAYYYPVDALVPTHTDEKPTLDSYSGAEGIPVFTPTMAEFSDFYAYCRAIDPWGMKSGIVKIVPPREWTDALPKYAPQEPDGAPLECVRIKNAITQHFLPAGPGLWRQTNITRTSSVWDPKQWADVCSHPSQRGPPLARVRRKLAAAVAAEQVHSNRFDEQASAASAISHGRVTRSGGASPAPSGRSASRAPAKTTKDEWLAFDPENCWLDEAHGADEERPQPGAWDAQICRILESEYWKSLNLGKPPMYGADLQGTLFDERTGSWNVGHLESLLTHLHISSVLPGVTTPYLYFGMWRASFAWHVEDMDLHSINYIHFGAPKQWYSIRQADRQRFESIMSAAFPSDARSCSNFMRHKSFVASPSFLASHGVKPLRLVQHAREFVITYPYGYHSGYNLGYNCAESVNFALPSWIDIGLKADYCKCAQAQESVRIDVRAILEDNKHLPEVAHVMQMQTQTQQKKRPREAQLLPPPKITRLANNDNTRYCVFCAAGPDDSLTPLPSGAVAALQRAPASRKSVEACSGRVSAHGLCAAFIPETWVEDSEVKGAENIEKARWGLKCAVCTDAKAARHGAKIQCTKGKCPRSAHVSCALDEPSGWFLDICEGPVADKLEGIKNGASTDERLVVLCRGHNPLWQEQEAARRAAEMYERIHAIEPGSWVRIKTGGGMWSTRLLSIDDETLQVVVDSEPEAGLPLESAQGVRVPWAKVLQKSDGPEGPSNPGANNTNSTTTDSSIDSLGPRVRKPKAVPSEFIAD
ncbi:hypothetical protein MCUN1_002097 [Malassezia cuniculi]|uniref:[histone H3]-trimethyl-L-lysine(9) demethylase n=1 Tax=Malassezia cuniculi TaxID=948313 RepID=A0AAF0EVT9_9BASI|nr:hypothetical protein MCUN1_002097 [Malassezia cuniculi]